LNEVKQIGFLIRKLIFVRIKQVGCNMFLANYIIVGIVIFVLVTFSILILCGKGDSLIAGYNTASAEEKAEYDIKRLRKVTGYGQLAICLPTGLIPMAETSFTLFWVSLVLLIGITAVIVILSNTYAKKVRGKRK